MMMEPGLQRAVLRWRWKLPSAEPSLAASTILTTFPTTGPRPCVHRRPRLRFRCEGLPHRGLLHPGAAHPRRPGGEFPRRDRSCPLRRVRRTTINAPSRPSTAEQFADEETTVTVSPVSTA